MAKLGQKRTYLPDLIEGDIVNENTFIKYEESKKAGNKPRNGFFKCKCGKEFKGRLSRVFSGEKKDCGCGFSFPFKSGEIIQGFEFVEYVEYSSNKYEKAGHFKCFCGNVFWSKCLRVERGLSKGCGCIVRKNGRIKMGPEPRYSVKATPEKKNWESAKDRCINPNNKQYLRYGGAEPPILMCERWLNDFGAFLEDMGPKPTPKHTLDRYPDKKGGYNLENCRWATAAQQANNRTDNVDIEIDGVIKTVTEWSILYGINRETVYGRIKMGWSLIDSITRVVQKKNKKVK